MNALFTVGFLLALMAMHPDAHAAQAVVISCPNSLLEQPQLKRKEGEWTLVTTTAERPLERAFVVLGPELELGALIPDTTKRRGMVEVDTWHLHRAPGDRFWIGCSYVGTTARAFSELAVEITACDVKYALLPGGQRLEVKEIKCR